MGLQLLKKELSSNLGQLKEYGLIYKISNRNKDEYKHLTLESEVSFEDAVQMYRVITGACSFGTRDFVLNRLQNRKEKYTIADIIKQTSSEYGGSAFAAFFKH